MMNKLTIALLCGTSLATVSLSAPAMAQSEPQATQGGIEEIVVTAQRRVERLENVPISMTALTPDALDKASVVNIHDLTRITPGVQMNFGGAYTQPSIRGITALTNGNGNENNVAFYIDGFFVSDNSSLNTDFAAISNIQVLKGPQGTLYGRQAAGGAILVNTLDPTKELSGKFEGRYGRFKERRLTGHLAGPLSDTLGFMVSGSYRNSDGYHKLASRVDPSKTIGPAAGIKQRSFRTKLRWEASDDLTVTAAYNYALSSDDRAGAQYTVKENIPLLVPGTNLPNPHLANLQYGFYTLAYNHIPLQVAETNQVTLKIEWDTPIGKLTSYTGKDYRRNRVSFDFDGGYNDTTHSDGNAQQRAFQQAIDFNIDVIERLDLIVGGLYFKDRYYTDEKAGGSQNFGANHVLIQKVSRETTTDAIAFYADANYHVTDALTIGVGGRYNIDKKGLELSSAFGPRYDVTDETKTFKKFTPRAVIRYELAARTNVYASFSQGYKAGSFNANGSSVNAIARVPIKAEVVTAYELGFKTAQRWFRIDTSAFYYNYKDLNISLTIQNPLGPAFGAATVIGNAPTAKIYGADFQVAVQPADKLNITLGGTYLHARYGTFPNASGVGVDPTNTFNINQPRQDWSKIQMARAPDFSANIAIDYTFEVARGSLRIGGDARYTDSYVPTNPAVFGPVAPVELRRKQRFRQPNHTLIGAEITWTDPTDHYWIGAYGTNLTGVKVKASETGTANGNYFLAGPPAQYGVKAGYKF